MTIEKGKEWGWQIDTPTDFIEVSSDAALIKHWICSPQSLFVVRGGDVFHSLGEPKTDMNQPTIQLLPFDVLRVEFVEDDSSFEAKTPSHEKDVHYAIASVEIGSWHSRHRYICVSNCGFVERRNVAPRAHLNDGEMDVLTVSESIPWRQRFQAWQRTQLGNHLPHPHLTMERGVRATWKRQSRSEKVRCDGVEVSGRGTNWQYVTISVIADAGYVLV